MRQLAVHLLLFTSMAATACSNDGPPVAPPLDLQAEFDEAWRRRSHTLGTDGEFLAVQAAVPEFAGYYFDESGTPVVLLTNPRASARASEVVRARLAARGVHIAGVRTRLVQWNVALLASWRDDLLASLSEEGVVFVDLDEQKNRVHVGISDHTARARVMRVAASAGVPASAVLVSDAAPFEPLSVLTDKIRPIPGGVRLTRFGGPQCTYGVNVRWANNITVPLFLSSAHCSKTMGQTESSWYFQANACGTGCFGQSIGFEYLDPPLFTGGICPAGRRCRWSDAALGNYDDTYNPTAAFGKIARTLSSDPVAGSKSIDPSNPYFQIHSEYSYPIGAYSIHKMGQTTGWTYGNQSQTCVAVNMASSDITLFCQYVVTSGALEGDSGAPAFYYFGGDNVDFLGLVWGGNGGSFVLSSVEGIEMDLGNITVF